MRYEPMEEEKFPIEEKQLFENLNQESGLVDYIYVNPSSTRQFKLYAIQNLDHVPDNLFLMNERNFVDYVMSKIEPTISKKFGNNPSYQNIISDIKQSTTLELANYFNKIQIDVPVYHN